MSTSILNFNQVRFRYRRGQHTVPPEARPAAAGEWAVDQLTLNPGERLLLRGPSGSGKTTLLSLAAGVLLADAGEVSVLDQDWRGLAAGRRDSFRAAHIGYIFQQFNLLPYLSVLDNVLLPCRFSAVRAQRAGAGPRAREDAARQWLRALDLAPGHWEQPAGQLSVGQQQRVAAARALLGSPELVIADEPTSALDEERRDAFMARLLEACQQTGSALLLVSHDARLARHFARTQDMALLRASAAPVTENTAWR
jgi:putative ABC transport system ATP-binding protein